MRIFCCWYGGLSQDIRAVKAAIGAVQRQARALAPVGRSASRAWKALTGRLGRPKFYVLMAVASTACCRFPPDFGALDQAAVRGPAMKERRQPVAIDGV